MKMHTLLFLSAFLISICTFSQTFEKNEKAITGIFEVSNKTQSEIFSSVNKWIAINYNSAKNVIQMNDREAGTIIVKGVNSVTYTNPNKLLYPKKTYIPDNVAINFNHTIQVNTKDNKLRLIYTLSNIVDKDVGYNYFYFKCINFNGAEQKDIEGYNSVVDKNLKASWVGKAKREKYLSKSESWFNEINEKIIADIKLTMKSIYNSVQSEMEEDW